MLLVVVGGDEKRERERETGRPCGKVMCEKLERCALIIPKLTDLSLSKMLVHVMSPRKSARGCS